MNYLNRIVFWATLLGVLLVANSQAIAQLSVSVTPVEGGSTLQFGRQDVLGARQKEVRVRITSNDGNQYQVVQRMIDPLTSTQSGIQNRDVIQYYGIVGSNSAGTLYAQSPDYLGRSEQLVFTSSGDGSSDRFVLAYTIDRERLTRSGQYYGRILFSVRPVSGGGAQQDVYLDVMLDAELDFQFDAKGERGREQIELSNERGGAPVYSVDFSYDGNLGELKVFQEMLRVPTNQQTGKDFPVKALLFYTRGSMDAEMPYVSPSVIGVKREMIYSSQLTADQFDAQYTVDEAFLSTLEAGEYRGQLRYEVVGANGSKEFIFDLSINIKPEFSIQLEFPEGPMKFENLFPGGPPQTYSVVARVNSNIGKPYSVTQELVTPLSNERGKRLDPEYFLVSVELLDESTGKALLPEFESVKERGETLFYSDKTGSPAQFRVLYQVRPYAEMEPGNYFTEVKFSLGEM